MKTLIAIIEKSENNYSAYLENVDGVVAVGASVDEIKQNMIEAIDILKTECVEFGCEIPEELTGEYELIFKMDVRSVLEFYSGIFTKAGLERITGINQKQLWHYASGNRNPRPEQVLKIETALHKLGQELVSISL
ncbi:MAG: type II toxin-antitoxin system HicB family antitoxin [Bacteroidales bacterium]